MKFNACTAYVNAKVYTANKDAPWAEAFTVENGKFTYVGKSGQARKFGGFVVDMKGAFITPGLIDSHAHPAADAALNWLNAIEVPCTMSDERAIELIKRKAQSVSRKAHQIITAHGITRPNCAITVHDLDYAVPDRPAILLTEDCHAAWVNSHAMRLMGINALTPDPIPNVSYFGRFSDGTPNGRIVEATALYPLIQKLGIFSANSIKKGLPKLFGSYSKFGYTGCIDAGFLMVDEQTALCALSEIESKNRLPLHYFTSYVYFGDSICSAREAVNKMIALREQYTSPLIHPNILKLHLDGTVELASAWMCKDYCIKGMGRGAPLLKAADMQKVATLAAKNGFDIHVHAIGDRAITEALNLMEKLGPISGTKTIAHCQIFPPDGVKRFAKQADVFMQTTANWLSSTDTFTKKMLGEERYSMQMPMASLEALGVPITFSSDSIGADAGLDPFFNIYHAILRKYDDGSIVMPPRSEGITLAQAIDAYTINAAKQAGAQNSIGSIESGKCADFTVFNKNPFKTQLAQLRTVRAQKTFFRGECIFNNIAYPLGFSHLRK